MFGGVKGALVKQGDQEFGKHVWDEFVLLLLLLCTSTEIWLLYGKFKNLSNEPPITNIGLDTVERGPSNGVGGEEGWEMEKSVWSCSALDFVDEEIAQIEID